LVLRVFSHIPAAILRQLGTRTTEVRRGSFHEPKTTSILLLLGNMPITDVEF
jgi:hypothetical protein